MHHTWQSLEWVWTHKLYFTHCLTREAATHDTNVKQPPTIKDVAQQWPQSHDAQHYSPLWVSQKGNQLSSPAMWRVVNRAVEACSSRDLIPKKTKPHDLRHTFAHRYLQQHSGDLVGLARLLGHESLDTTKIYTQLTSGELAQRVEQLSLNAYG